LPRRLVRLVQLVQLKPTNSTNETNKTNPTDHGVGTVFILACCKLFALKKNNLFNFRYQCLAIEKQILGFRSQGQKVSVNKRQGLRNDIESQLRGI
jgi:hypothetical protein